MLSKVNKVCEISLKLATKMQKATLFVKVYVKVKIIKKLSFLVTFNDYITNTLEKEVYKRDIFSLKKTTQKIKISSTLHL